jgi:class 3 adenylate cyclase
MCRQLRSTGFPINCGVKRCVLLLELEGRNIPDPSRDDASARAQDASQVADGRTPTDDLVGGGLQDRRLRFVNERLEHRYQRQGGAESLTGFRITTGVAAAMWLLATVVIPAGTEIPLERATLVGSAMGLVNGTAFVLSDRVDTLDRQHSIISVLTSVNGLVILWLASTGGMLPGYGISAIMLLFAFGFVSRTGFVFAALRSAVIVVGFAVAAIRYPGPGSLQVDAFIFGAAVIGTLVALRLLEQSRRRVFYQDIVIRQQADALALEKERADALLLNVLPASISARLLDGERTIADEYPAVTVLFADIVGFTPLVARLPADEVIGLLGRLFTRFDELVAARGLEKIKTIGDAYMAAGGLPEPLDDHAARVVDLGLAMIEVAAQEGQPGGDLRLRIGVHSGPVIGGVIGHGKFAFDVWGDTVNIASRLESQGVPGRVHVSEATWRKLGDRFDGERRGPIDLRGHGPMETYTIVRRHDRPGETAVEKQRADSLSKNQDPCRESAASARGIFRADQMAHLITTISTTGSQTPTNVIANDVTASIGGPTIGSSTNADSSTSASSVTAVPAMRALQNVLRATTVRAPISTANSAEELSVARATSTTAMAATMKEPIQKR